MSDIAPIGPLSHPGRTETIGRNGSYADTEVKPSPAPTRPGDTVEVSSHARYLDQLSRMPEVRHDRVEELRDKIASGTYETNERLDVAIDHLIDDLSSE